MNELLLQIRSCTVCKEYLPFAPRPIIQASKLSKIVIVGQAPGRRVQESGIPWNDASGDNLRRWLLVDKATFYDDKVFALLPMGFCYPGTGKSGDLPPRPECAPLWHKKVLDMMPEVKLILLIGQYAQSYYLKSSAKESLTETVRCYLEYLPYYLPLPHPSPRNNIWQKKNAWFNNSVIPTLQERVTAIIKAL